MLKIIVKEAKNNQSIEIIFIKTNLTLKTMADIPLNP